MKCKIESCSNERKKGRSMCSKHCNQWDRHGRIFERTIFDDNEIVEYDGYAKMSIYNKDCEVIAITLIDIDDIDFVRLRKWSLSADGYVTTKIDSKNVRLHNYVLRRNADNDNPCDHINRNKLDNRKSNLRITDRITNSMNCNYYDEMMNK